MRLFFIFLFVFSGSELLLMAQTGTRLDWNDGTHFVHGVNYGNAPIYRDSAAGGYLFLEGESKLNIKNIPLDIKFRISNEKYYYGQSNYFKISYNAARYRGILKNNYLKEIEDLDKLIKQQKQTLSDYESKWSYYRYKYPNGLFETKKPTLGELKNNIPKLPNNLPDTFNLDIKKPPLPTIGVDLSIDSIETHGKLPSGSYQQGILQDSINALKQRIEKYTQLYNQLQADYAKLNKFKGTDFMSKIKTADIGLTGLKTGGSGTTIPVQGVNFSYQDNTYFIEAAAGFTLPNQIVTTNIYQQLAYSHANVFNSGIGSFFNINSTKILARTNVGYGNQETDNIAVETFYNSRAFRFNKNDSLYNVSLKDKLTTNINGQLRLLPQKNLLLKASVGVTWLDENTPVFRLIEHLGGYVSSDYMLKNQKISASYRYLTANYDAWVQGIFLAQNERMELAHQLKLVKKWNLRYHYARNRYFSNTIFGGTISNEYGLNTGYYGRNSGFSLNYALLQMTDRNQSIIVNNKLNHMGGFMFYWNKNLKRKGRYALTMDNNTLFLDGRDTAYKIVTTSISNRFSFDRFYVGLTLKHQYYEGLKSLNGNFYIIQPEIGIKVRYFYFRGFLAICKSEGNEWSIGGSGEIGFRFNKHLSWSFEAQKYLKNEYFLFRNLPNDVQPYIVKLKMIIDL